MDRWISLKHRLKIREQDARRLPLQSDEALAKLLLDTFEAQEYGRTVNSATSIASISGATTLVTMTANEKGSMIGSNVSDDLR